MDKVKRVLLLLRPSPGREALVNLLAGQGYNVDAQPSTFRAVSSLARTPRDVVLVGLDDLLDEEIEVVRVIREECPAAFLILTVSSINRRRIRHALSMGADSYVLEPLDPAEVISVLKHLGGIPPVDSTDTISAGVEVAGPSEVAEPTRLFEVEEDAVPESDPNEVLEAEEVDFI